MRVGGFVLLIGFLCIVSTNAQAEPAGNVSIGVKSENLRFGGGRVVSENPVLVTSGQVSYDHGVYLRYWGTAGEEETDDELNLGIGIVKPCFGTLKCKVEIMYWILPDLDESRGDLINFTLELSGGEKFSDGTSVGFTVRAEELLVFAKPDTQLFRLNGFISTPIGGIPVKLSAEYAYNRIRDWHHVPLSLSATFTPDWLPEGVSITPSVDVLIPLNEQDTRDVGLAFGISLTKTW